MNAIEINQAASRIAEAYGLGNSVNETTDQLAEAITNGILYWFSCARTSEILNDLATALQEQATQTARIK